MLFNLLLLCIALYQCHAITTENVWIDPIKSNLTSLWEIVVTPNTTNQIPTSTLYYLYSNVINIYAYDNYNGNYINFQWSIDSQTLLNNEWTPITFYTASDPKLVFLDSSITVMGVNFAISPVLVTSTYNPACANDVLDTFITTNLLNTNDPKNCLITNTGFSPCDDDDDCSDGLICNTNSLSTFSTYFTQDYKFFYLKKWCTTPDYLKPSKIAGISGNEALAITENVPSNAEYNKRIAVTKDSSGYTVQTNFMIIFTILGIGFFF